MIGVLVVATLASWAVALALTGRGELGFIVSCVSLAVALGYVTWAHLR